MSYDFPHRIKSLRIERKMNQTELAELIGCTPNTVSRWERGITRPNGLDLYVMSDKLGVDVRWLLGLEKSRPMIP